MSKCASCEADVNEDVDRTCRRLLAPESLGEERAGTLAEWFSGQLPEVLCAACFIPFVGQLNAVYVAKRAQSAPPAAVPSETADMAAD